MTRAGLGILAVLCELIYGAPPWGFLRVVESSNGAWSGGMVELLNRRNVDCWNGGVVESSNLRMVEWWSSRIVNSSNGGKVELSNRRMVELWSCLIIE